MNRVKIALPEQFPFSTRIRIRITDLNYGGHVGNDTFLSLIHEARQQFLRSLGYGELEFEGIGLIMADASIEFKSELNFGDEVEVKVAPADLTKFGFDLYYEMQIIRPSGNVLAAKVKTGMLCFDYAVRKLAALPPTARENLKFSS